MKKQQQVHVGRTLWLLLRQGKEEGEAPVPDPHFLFFLKRRMLTACLGCGCSLARMLTPLLGACGLGRCWWWCTCGDDQG